MGMTSMLGAVRCLVRIDRHAADRIDHAAFVSAVMMSVVVRHDLTLANDTLGGYISLMRNEIKASCTKRLQRIEGQVRGISRMVEEDRYCIDVVTQIAAVRAALRRVEEEVLRDHVSHCVEHAIASGSKAEQRRKIEELMAVVSRADR